MTNATTPVVPIPPVPPRFNPTDPLSITWYVTAVLTIIGFVLHKDLTDWTGPAALGVFAVVGIAQGIVQAMKQNTYNHTLQHYNQVRIDHYVNIDRPSTDYAYHDDVANAFRQVDRELNRINSRLDEKTAAKPAKKTAAKKTASKKTDVIVAPPQS